MKVIDLIKGLDATVIAGASNCDVAGVVCDSRQVRKGFLFVAIAGAKSDGWNYIGDAIKKGAVCIVSERKDIHSDKLCQIHVDDARKAVGVFASRLNGYPSNDLNMIGITGTNGKTTTAYIVQAILSSGGMNPGMLTTVEYKIGARSIPAVRTTPEAPELQGLLRQMVDAKCASAVMEVSSHSLVQQRIAGIDFDVAVFTNLTHDHLDYHKDMQSYFEAKKLLFDGLGHKSKIAMAVINIDDKWGRELVQTVSIDAHMLTYSLDSDASVSASDINISATGTTFICRTPWGESKVQTPLLGRFNVSNIMAAIAACGSVGIDIETICKVIKNINPAPGRLELIKGKNTGFHVFVDYAHTDDALKNVLLTLREIVDRKLIVVFGCGGNRDKSKRPAMGGVAQELADYSILTSDNPRMEKPGDIISQIKDGFLNDDKVEVVEDRKDAIKRAFEIAQNGDVVLIAGKGHENFQEFANTTSAFDDRQVVRDLLG